MPPRLPYGVTRATTRHVKRLAIALLVAAAAGAPSARPRAPTSRSTTRSSSRAADGTAVAVEQTIRVWCGPWASDVRKPSIHVRAGTRSGLWTMSAVLADVRRRPVVRFPHSFVFDKPTRAQLFAADGRNEASTAEEESSGRITFTRRSLRLAPGHPLRVDGVMGSEFSDGTPIAIRGTFSARG